MKQGLLSVFVASATLGGSSVEADNAFPIIGIVAQPTWSALCPNGKSCEYVAASYVKFVESHGARAVPISYYTDDESANTLFESLNGVLFPGGANVKVPPVAHLMYNKAVAANAAGDVFPLWGTCLGFEWLVELAGGTLDGGFAAENVSLPLTMTDAAPTSTLFTGLDSGLYTMLQGEDTSAFNYHTMGITPAHFMATPSLAETFTVLSTSKDRKGKAFVSTMEAADPKLPFYGVQWHPEKNVWELGKDSNGNPHEAIPHTPEAIELTLHLSQVFVKAAQKSNHKFATPAAEAAALIWNYEVFSSAVTRDKTFETAAGFFEEEYIADFFGPVPSVIKKHGSSQ